jgi:cell division protein FtsW
MPAQRSHMDLITLTAVLTLMVMSLGVVYSASATWMLAKGHDSGQLLASHAMKVLLGFMAIFIFMQIDYKEYKKLSKGGLIIAVVLLVLTLVLGGELNGAARWLRVGGFSFQPSELAKLALIVHLSVMMAAKGSLMQDWKKGFVPAMIWILAVAGLVLIQPNRSTGTMILAIGLTMVYFGGARLRHLALTASAGVPALVGFMFVAGYSVKRLAMYAEGFGHIDKMSYQLRQALIGIGNGGVLGLGPGNSIQRDLFLPESYGDFVFSIVGEEYGVIGALAVIGLFLLIMVRGMKIARHAPDDLGRYLALGITINITLYALVHVGVVLGLLPTTGLPMPFVSYGGTSMLFSCAAVGVLLNISRQTDLDPRLRAAAEPA